MNTEDSIPQATYEIQHRDGKTTWQAITPSPLLDYTREGFVVPPEEVGYSSALLSASYLWSTTIGGPHSGMKIYRAAQRKAGIPFSALAQKYECIGVCTVGNPTTMLFPTVFDLLGFLAQYPGAFMLASLQEIGSRVSSLEHFIVKHLTDSSGEKK